VTGGADAGDRPLALDDIQGLVLFAYAAQPCAAYLHLAIPEGGGARACSWIRGMEPRVTCAHKPEASGGERLNVAFTWEGLAHLGLTERELGLFPREFRHGMANELRTRVLGDEGVHHPSTWELGGPKNPKVHALLMIFADDAPTLEASVARERETLHTHGIAVVHEDRGEIREREHFGFVDGIEQPHVVGSPRRRPPHSVEVAAGEFVLGYDNAYGEQPLVLRGDDATDFGENGSFLVYRKLAQDVAGFWRAMYERAETTGDPDADERAAIAIAARIVGRWPSGAPLVHYPDADVADGAPHRADFAFVESGDPAGLRCPLGAHIRRANPRDMFPPDAESSLKSVARHRLLRRGRTYGPPPAARVRDRVHDDEVDRGLLFLAINASIRRQFEFIQQTWINSPKFAGLYDERDPLVATAKGGPACFTIQQSPVRKRLLGLPTFVTTRGGAYYFVPGRRALGWLAARSAEPRA